MHLQMEPKRQVADLFWSTNNPIVMIQWGTATVSTILPYTAQKQIKKRTVSIFETLHGNCKEE